MHKIYFQFLENFRNEFSQIANRSISYEGCITFECIYSKNQLILPSILNELLLEEKVSDNEVLSFNEFLLNNYSEEAIIDLIPPMLYIKEIPHEIIAKYFLRAYTEETSFYKVSRSLSSMKKSTFWSFSSRLWNWSSSLMPSMSPPLNTDLVALSTTI